MELISAISAWEKSGTDGKTDTTDLQIKTDFWGCFLLGQKEVPH
jgi:hypothetical protein